LNKKIRQTRKFAADFGVIFYLVRGGHGRRKIFGVHKV